MSKSINNRVLISKVSPFFSPFFLALLFVFFFSYSSFAFAADDYTKEDIKIYVKKALVMQSVRKWNTPIKYSLEFLVTPALQKLFDDQITYITEFSNIDCQHYGVAGDQFNAVFFVTNNLKSASSQDVVRNIFGNGLSDAIYKKVVDRIINYEMIGGHTYTGDDGGNIYFYSWLGDPSKNKEDLVDYFSTIILDLLIVGIDRIEDDGSYLHSRKREFFWFSIFELSLIKTIYSVDIDKHASNEKLIDNISTLAFQFLNDEFMMSGGGRYGKEH